MPYLGTPRGGADRIWDDPVPLIDDIALFDPENPINNKDKNKYKHITDTLLYGGLFYVVLMFLDRVKRKQKG